MTIGRYVIPIYSDYIKTIRINYFVYEKLSFPKMLSRQQKYGDTDLHIVNCNITRKQSERKLKSWYCREEGIYSLKIKITK